MAKSGNAYFIFVSLVRSEDKVIRSQKTSPLNNCEISQRWKKLTQQEKEQFFEIARKNREEKRIRKEYNAKRVPLQVEHTSITAKALKRKKPENRKTKVVPQVMEAVRHSHRLSLKRRKLEESATIFPRPSCSEQLSSNDIDEKRMRETKQKAKHTAEINKHLETTLALEQQKKALPVALNQSEQLSELEAEALCLKANHAVQQFAEFREGVPSKSIQSHQTTDKMNQDGKNEIQVKLEGFEQALPAASKHFDQITLETMLVLEAQNKDKRFISIANHANQTSAEIKEILENKPGVDINLEPLEIVLPQTSNKTAETNKKWRNELESLMDTLSITQNDKDQSCAENNKLLKNELEAQEVAMAEHELEETRSFKENYSDQTCAEMNQNWIEYFEQTLQLTPQHFYEPSAEINQNMFSELEHAVPFKTHNFETFAEAAIEPNMKTELDKSANIFELESAQINQSILTDLELEAMLDDLLNTPNQSDEETEEKSSNWQNDFELEALMETTLHTESHAEQPNSEIACESLTKALPLTAKHSEENNFQFELRPFEETLTVTANHIDQQSAELNKNNQMEPLQKTLPNAVNHFTEFAVESNKNLEHMLEIEETAAIQQNSETELQIVLLEETLPFTANRLPELSEELKQNSEIALEIKAQKNDDLSRKTAEINQNLNTELQIEPPLKEALPFTAKPLTELSTELKPNLETLLKIEAMEDVLTHQETKIDKHFAEINQNMEIPLPFEELMEAKKNSIKESKVSMNQNFETSHNIYAKKYNALSPQVTLLVEKNSEINKSTETKLKKELKIIPLPLSEQSALLKQNVQTSHVIDVEPNNDLLRQGTHFVEKSSHKKSNSQETELWIEAKEPVKMNCNLKAPLQDEALMKALSLTANQVPKLSAELNENIETSVKIETQENYAFKVDALRKALSLTANHVPVFTAELKQNVETSPEFEAQKDNAFKEPVACYHKKSIEIQHHFEKALQVEPLIEKNQLQSMEKTLLYKENHLHELAAEINQNFETSIQFKPLQKALSSKTNVFKQQSQQKNEIAVDVPILSVATTSLVPKNHVTLHTGRVHIMKQKSLPQQVKPTVSTNDNPYKTPDLNEIFTLLKNKKNVQLQQH